MLHAMRIATMNNKQLRSFYNKTFQKNVDDKIAIFQCEAFSKENERDTIQILQSMISQLLGQYPTTIEEDETIIKTDISLNKHVAIGYRIERKKILANTLNHIKNMQ